MNENEQLNERLAEFGGDPQTNPPHYPRPEAMELPSPPSPQQSHTKTDMDFAQWQTGVNGKYRPGSRTVKTLLEGAYRLGADDFGPYLERMNILSDDVIELPDTATQRVLTSIKTFWQRRARYDKHGLIYKRGILLWGPPGSGKTVTVQMLTRELISQHRGIVLMCDHPQLTVAVLNIFRKIEPTRPLIIILEDIDEIITHHGEHSVLAMLDGEHQTDNIVYLATTNYPERLGARIVNRPSRFDDRILVGMPTAAARLCYLSKMTGSSLGSELDTWVKDTSGMSIAHLRELVAAVFCLDQPYEEVIDRLKLMMFEPKPLDGYRRATIGLAGTLEGKLNAAQQRRG